MFSVPAETVKNQAIAADPAVSAWVSANAGSGKTFVLARRVIRLMLSGVAPSKILCLTFTKAAAAEMAGRVFKVLSEWTMLDDGHLQKALADVLNRAPNPRETARARQLFAMALDTPGGLKIQTIHAFCEALLHQFALEANVPAHFEVVDDVERDLLLANAQAQVLMQTLQDANLAEAMAILRDCASDHVIENTLNEFTHNHEELLHWIDRCGGVEAASLELRLASGLQAADTRERIIQKSFEHSEISGDEWRDVMQLAADEGTASNVKFAEKIGAFIAEKELAKRFDIKNVMLLTQKNEPRAKLLYGKLAKERLDLVEILQHEQTHHLDTLEKLAAEQLALGSSALFTIGRAIVERYTRQKRARALVDFGDLISRSANLLTRKNMHQWVQYKLDRGIDHILVDEAQDTSPTQWVIINALNGDFFSGLNASMKTRSMFAVGDKKQSIYSFQGARPEEFSSQAEELEQRVREADEKFEPVSLNLSFRSTADVMEAVDVVFRKDLDAVRGLGEDDGTVHTAARTNQPGEVLLWDPYIKQKVEKKTDWLAPIDQTSDDDSVVALANRITETIKQWRGTLLPGTGELIKAGDIMVLVRKRDRFAKALTRALKEAGIPVSGADRLKLSEHIAIEDLIALGRFAVNPDDDLSLACVLKSPLFGIDEEMLFDASHGRKEETLYQHMQNMSQADSDFAARLKKTCSSLEGHILNAATLPVHEFYANVLGKSGARKQFLQRLGGEVEDVLDAFLARTLTFERSGSPGLDSFLQAVSVNAPEIKRVIDSNRDEVRIMTVHSSKGLEAPIVFLVDPCTAAYGSHHRPQLRKVELSTEKTGWLWQPKKETATDLTRQADIVSQRLSEEEYRRLLYVGMTRAADKLIVCGYANASGPDAGCWYKMVEQALKPDDRCREITDTDGETIEWRFRINHEAKSVDGKKTQEEVGSRAETDLPSWLNEKVPFEPPLPRPLSPSGVFALIEENDATVPSASTPSSPKQGNLALARGNATHRLLQYLPDITPSDRSDLAESYLQTIKPELNDRMRQDIAREVLTVMSSDANQDLFGPNAQVEVALAGTIKLNGKERIVSGQVDRLIVSEDRVRIIDYKTNRQAPSHVSETPKSYLAQMALYREILKEIYPDKRVECLLLWTATCETMTISDQILDNILFQINAA